MISLSVLYIVLCDRQIFGAKLASVGCAGLMSFDLNFDLKFLLRQEWKDSVSEAGYIRYHFATFKEMNPLKHFIYLI